MGEPGGPVKHRPGLGHAGWGRAVSKALQPVTSTVRPSRYTMCFLLSILTCPHASEGQQPGVRENQQLWNQVRLDSVPTSDCHPHAPPPR